MTIKQKQWQLYYLGYYGGEIDGIWAAQSKAAAVRFQKDYDLDADGIFGASTIAKSIEIIKAIQKEVTDGKIAIDGLAGQETKDAILNIIIILTNASGVTIPETFRNITNRITRDIYRLCITLLQLQYNFPRSSPDRTAAGTACDSAGIQ